jgi:hypothetical protein
MKANRCFGGNIAPSSGSEIKPGKKLSCYTVHADFSLDLLSEPKDGEYMFL